MTVPTLTTRELPGGIKVTTETRVASTSMIPFIRPRKIHFMAEGLLPNTRHRPYFDGVDVSAYCRSDSFENRPNQTWPSDGTTDAANAAEHPDGSTTLISDSDGVLEGTFYIPNNNVIRFKTGNRQFKLLDWNATTDKNAVSSAFTSYSATGILQTDEILTTTIIPAPPVSRPPDVRYMDPVAQSFVIEKTSGAFVTSIDLFLQTKSQTVPLQVQIREMENGTPTSRVIPGAEVFVLPANVNISAAPVFTNNAHRTKATFPTPIYLEGFVEYAIVVLAETTDYNIWTAVTTEKRVGSTTAKIMKQPASGSFFKSQNGSTWTPDQSRDLMFRLNRAEFTTSAATAVFENANLPIVKLISNPVEILEIGASPDVRVYQRNHGLVPGAKVVLSGLTATRGLTTGNLNAEHTVVEVENHDTYVITTAGTSSSLGTGGGDAAFASRGVMFSTIFPNVNEMVLPNAEAEWQVKYTTAQSPMGTETAFLKDSDWSPLFPGVDNTYNRAQMVANEETEDDVIGGKSLSVRANLSTTDSYISPVIDLSRLSLILIGNRIDNPAAAPATGFNVPSSFVAETDPSEGSAIAKHLTIPVTLAQQAVGMRVLYAANRPPDSFIDLYYRVLPVGASGDITRQPWVLVETAGTPPPDDDPRIFREYDNAIPADPGTELPPFNTYQFKFVFRSTSVAKVPRLRDLRGIALGT